MYEFYYLYCGLCMKLSLLLIHPPAVFPLSQLPLHAPSLYVVSMEKMEVLTRTQIVTVVKCVQKSSHVIQNSPSSSTLSMRKKWLI